MDTGWHNADPNACHICVAFMLKKFVTKNNVGQPPGLRWFFPIGQQYAKTDCPKALISCQPIRKGYMTHIEGKQESSSHKILVAACRTSEFLFLREDYWVFSVNVHKDLLSSNVG
ncbi:hypothetical protein CsatB_004241 [Cannabis sativa]|uniref:Uncharacterized protein n=1 Tax=Cannabis sativa TaxID=3483 RepID=A0A803PM88_CANSA